MPVVRGQIVRGLPLKQVNSDSATESASRRERMPKFDVKTQGMQEDSEPHEKFRGLYKMLLRSSP